MRPAPVQRVNAAPAQNAAPAPAPAGNGAGRPFRRQMPEPLTNMSSFKERQAAVEAMMKQKQAEETVKQEENEAEEK